MNFESFTDKVISAIQTARAIALSRKNPNLTPVHMLGALLQDPKGLTSSLLNRVNVPLETLQSHVERAIQHQPSQDPPGEPRSTPGMLKMFAKAGEHQRSNGDSFVAVDHIILGMYEDADAKKCMDTAGMPKDKVIEALKAVRGNRKVTSKSAEDTFDALSKFGVNLVESAETAKLDPVIGREDEIKRVIRILSRRTKNNPVLVGEPGVGKTAIVEGLAQRIVRGDVPEKLRPAYVYSLDMGALVAGASVRGEFEERLKAVIEEVQQSTSPVILFIDEIHLVLGAGRDGGAMDAANILKPALARGQLRCIGATTLDEYRKYVEKDAAFERRFQQVYVKEPTVLDTISILRGLREKYEAHHGVRITDAAIVSAAQLADRYITQRFLPDKAIDLIDEACSSIRVQLDSQPEIIDTLERKRLQLQVEETALKKEKDTQSKQRLKVVKQELANVEAQLKPLQARYELERGGVEQMREVKQKLEDLHKKLGVAENRGNTELAADLKYGAIPELESKLKTLDENHTLNKQHLEETGQPLLSEVVNPEQIAEVVSRWTGIPVSRLSKSERERLITLKTSMSGKVIGQEEAVHSVANAVLRSRAGLSDEGKPQGSFLFLGPTGVGKTQLAKVLAQQLFDDDKTSLIRLDMSEYMEEHSVARMIGAPPGYVGYDQGGQLTEAVRRKPYSVVLFDEVEKAHRSIFNCLLQLLDDGRLTDGKGRTVDFSNTVVVMTSNLGANYLLDNKSTEGIIDAEVRKNVMEVVRNHFRPEFLNRLDDVIIFKPLTNTTLRDIVKIQTMELGSRLVERDIDLTFTDRALDHIVGDAFKPEYGARPLKRYIEKYVITQLGRLILQNKLANHNTVSIDVVNNGGQMNMRFGITPKPTTQI